MGKPASHSNHANRPGTGLWVNIILLIIGAAISWYISRYYYRRSLADAETNKQAALLLAEANKRKEVAEARANERKAFAEAEAARDETIAKYVVAAMLPQHPVKDSKELQQRVDQYLVALRRTKADPRGTPVYRKDGSIGVDWSISLTESIGIKTGT